MLVERSSPSTPSDASCSDPGCAHPHPMPVPQLVRPAASPEGGVPSVAEEPAAQPSWVSSTVASGLLRIREPGVKIAVWQRTLASHWSSELEAWARTRPPLFDQSFGARGYDLSGAFQSLPSLARGFIQADAENLVRGLLQVYAAPRFKLFFGAVHGDQCRKFHVDYVHLRLLCTYLGPGSHWLAEDNLDRAALVAGADGGAHGSPEAANLRIVRRDGEIKRASVGDVLVMKGDSYPAEPGLGAVHRSPPIEGSGEVRVLLTLSVSDAERV